jgi:two-component system, NtrC family, sensor histidine kinase PilS
LDPLEAERRQGDRRHQDRRRAAGRRRDDPLLDALGTEGGGSEAPVTADDSFFDAGWLAAGDSPPDSRYAMRQARRLALAQESALARVYRIYGAARAVIGLGLVAVHGLGGLVGARSTEVLALVSVLYAVQAVTVWLLPRFGNLTQPAAGLAQRRRQWLSTIGVDLLAFSLLYLLEAGATFNYAALLVLPVLMAGVLTSRLLALGTAAGVTLLLLLVAWRAQQSPDAASLMLQSGLAGLGLFMITLLSGELAGRLAREEQAARGSLELARQQAQLNRLVIQEMADGVLVVDRSGHVRAANPAARALLVAQGLCPPAPFTLQAQPAWTGLQKALERALAEGVWPDAGRDVVLAFEAGHNRTLRLRVRFMRGQALGLGAGPQQAPGGKGHGSEPFAVLLLEDVRTLQARIRQEKLAAMGRVSAGIAHEVRNPLAAIAQANALLMEDQPAPSNCA